MSKTILHPLGSRVVIKRIQHDEKSKGGLFIPDSAKEKPHRGSVIAVSPDSKLAVGDLIVFGKYAGIELTIDDELVLVLKEEDVVAKVEVVE